MIGSHLYLMLVLSAISLLAQAQNTNLGVYPPHCGPVCSIFCPYGNVVDSRGCPTCECIKRPVCPSVPCTRPCHNGYEEVNGCPTCTCKSTYPTYCGPVCKIGCPNGLETDSRGCPICKCKPVIDTCRERCQRYCQTNKNQPYDCTCDCAVYRPLSG